MAQLFALDHAAPIRITARGAWLHGDTPLHPRVEALFARSVVAHADGRYSLAVGRATHPLEVADTAFHVRRQQLFLSPTGEVERVQLHLSDGVEEPLAADSLMQSAECTLYCRLQRSGLAVPCRFSPAQYHELALHMLLEEEQAILPLGSARHPVAPYVPLPCAASAAGFRQRRQ